MMERRQSMLPRPPLPPGVLLAKFIMNHLGTGAENGATEQAGDSIPYDDWCMPGQES